MKKRVLSIFLALVMILALLPVSAFADVTASGTDGNIIWTLDSSGTLTISGTGAMKNYTASNCAPWYLNRENIKTVDIKSGVTSIGNYAFYDYGSHSGLTSITIPDSVTSIGNYAFYGCAVLESVAIPDGVTTISSYVFSNCTGLTSVTIPDSITSIGNSAFSYCTGLTSIAIPDGVTSIGNSAFIGCTGLTSIAIPDGVTSIGNSVFSGCTGLTSIAIPDGVTSIGNSVFSGCTGLTSIAIPDGVTSIGNSAFSGCTGLTSVTMPDYVTSIGESAFCNCTGLTSITIPDSVTSIEYEAFEGCTGLASITLSDNVSIIAGGVFRGCTGLTSVTIPDSVTSIEYQAFYGCIGLARVTIPDSVTSIGVEAFENCRNITDVYYYGTEEQWNAITVGEYNEDLIYGTIHYNYKPHEHSYTAVVTNPTCKDMGYTTHTCSICGDSYVDNYVDALGHNYLNGQCTRCKEWSEDIIGHGTCGKDLTWMLRSNGTLTISGTGAMTDYSLDESAPWCSNGENIKTVDIKSGVTSIGDDAFYGCTGIKSITIPDSVTSIGSYAFSKCIGLTSVTIPDSITSIEYWAFSGCTGLESITIPDSVTSIEGGAFYYCLALTSVNIPGSVTSIGNGAFEDCSDLADVCFCGTEEQWNTITVGSDNECLKNAARHYHNYVDGVCTICGTKEEASVASGTCGENLTWVLDETGTLTISGTGDMTDYSYSNNAPWNSNSADIKTVDIKSGVTSIGNSAFKGCTGLTSATIPDGVTDIGNCAFKGCTGLTSVTIPNGVTSIGWSAFEDCTGLTVVTIPESVRYIDVNAFSRCDSLANIEVSSQNEKYASIDGVLFNKAKTTLIQYPGGKNGSYTIPDGVETIYWYSFFGCTGLTGIIMPESVTGIGDSAFYDCTGLTNVTVSDNLTYIGCASFMNCTGLTNITIPDGVTSIGYNAFYGCTGLESITIPDGVTSIDGNTFSGCTGLTSVIIPGSVTGISSNAFQDCSSLADVYYCGTEEQWNAIAIGENNECLKNAARHYHNYVDGVCTICGAEETAETSGTCGENLTWVLDETGTLTISGTGDMYNYSYTYYSDGGVYITTAPWGRYYSSITNVVINPGVTSIGEYALDCPGITSITIPDSVTSFENCAFGECFALKTVYYNGNAASWVGISFKSNPCCYGADLYFNGKLVTALEIPDGVTNIGSNAFSSCQSLTSVEIPDSVTSIGDSAFSFCSNLASVTIGNGVTSIGDDAFKGCHALTSVTIPDSVTSIGNYAFYDCPGLTSVTIGNGVTSIGNCAFGCCTGLTSVVIPVSVTSIGWAAFDRGSITDIYYEGSEAQWQQISINEYNDCLTQATIHYNCVSHTHYYTATVTAPTCTEQGYTTYTCSCGDSYVDDYTEATGHSYTATVKKATTKALGYTTYTCSVCGDSYKANYTVAAPTISISRSSGKPKISWSAIGGATKYYVYRSTDGKTYKYLTSTTKTSCTNTKASSGKKYYYKVKAVAVVDGKNIYSAYSNVKYMVTTLTAPTVSITRSNGHPKLTWKSVTGADKYIVYYSTDGKSYSKLVTTTKLSVTHTKAKAGKTYYYKVKAVSNQSSNATSAYSKAVSIKAK